MSSANSEGDGGGLPGPSAVVQGGGVGAVIQIAGHLANYAAGPGDKLAPLAAVHLALRSPAERRELLEQVILEVCPNGVNESLWLEWLAGGPSPFETRLRKIGPGQEKPSRTLSRSTPRVASARDKVAKAMEGVEAARSQLEAAEEKAKVAERELQETENYESAAVHWHVVHQLLGIMAPAFAMGPAWTVMRALSAHLSDAEADVQTDVLVGKEKDDAIAAIRAARVIETSKMMELLDLASGHSKFEASLRSAVLKVCNDWEKKRDALMADGRKPRSSEKVKDEIHPKASNEAESILDGLRKAS